jgi:hypothetical protein
MTRHLVVLSQAAVDIEAGIDFYNGIEAGVGTYFKYSIMSDIRRVGSFFGQHAIHFGFHRALSDRFPFAIYYRDRENLRQVVAILDMRRDPASIKRQLLARDP